MSLQALDAHPHVAAGCESGVESARVSQRSASPWRTKPNPIQSAARELFDLYKCEFNAGLTGEVDLEAVAALYAEAFIAASPAGVFARKNDDELRKVSEQGFKHYRETGMQRMNVRKLDVSAIDELHGLARMEWRAIYKVDGAQKVINFTNVYLMR